jgi:histidinol-phosphate aminotransferase
MTRPPDPDLGRFAATSPQPKPGILEIVAYKPGKASAEGVADPVKLSANENILGCSEKAREAFGEAAFQLNLYPDGRANALRATLAARYRIEPERIVLGTGTDEIFQIVNQTFLENGDNIVQGEYGFGAYAIGARACGGEVRYAPEPGKRIDVGELLAQVDERTRVVFIANPANPTGTFITEDEVRRLAAELPPSVVLVLDGAYAEFCTDPRYTDGLDLARDAGNVIVTHTFSKLHGLAALRVGWAYCPAPIAAAMDRIRLPFNVSIPAQHAAIAALADEDFQRRSIAHVERWRPWLTQQLGGLGLEVVPSGANFVLVKLPSAPGKTAPEAEAFLASRGLLVRGVGNYGLPDHLRLTIGLEAHNRAMVEALGEFLK